MRGAEAVVKALEQEGIRYISGFAGGGLNPLWGPLRASSIRPFAARHERLGVEIADGYARATGEVGVAMTGTGPGATNCLTGIAGCYADNVPVLLLMGQHPLRNLGQEWQQEVSPSIFDGLCKWRGTFTRVQDIPQVMRRAFTALRSGSPGPVVLEMHQDVLTAEADESALAYTPVGAPGKAGPSDAEVQRAADMLVNASFPILNVGGGALSAGAAAEVLEIAEMLSMPVASTIMGKGVFPENHPLSLGGGVYPRSRYASGAAIQINRKADVVLAVGNSFRQPNGTDGRPIPQGVSIIHINADPADLNKTYQVDLPMLADAKLALRAIIQAVRQRLGPPDSPSYRGGLKQEIVDEIRACHEKAEAEWMPRFTDPDTPTNGYRVVHELQQVIDPDRTIALHDAGGSRGYVVPFWMTTQPRNFVAMGGMAAMGWSVGAAIGAKLGRPDHLVVHVLGDASFGMTGMDLETAGRMGLPILTVVINNGGTGGGMMGMEDPNGTPPEVAVLGGNFSIVADGLGCYSQRVENPDELQDAFRRAIRATEEGQSAMVEVMIRPLPTPELPDNWSL
jgi:acetolactate synthase-1/2/3 large subunit